MGDYLGTPFKTEVVSIPLDRIFWALFLGENRDKGIARANTKMLAWAPGKFGPWDLLMCDMKGMRHFRMLLLEGQDQRTE